ncbi:MAG: hypothetical protein J1E01_00705 [Acetatifactor sp.]|nr:hypothetical protein [Acetatifactor sp.]
MINNLYNKVKKMVQFFVFMGILLFLFCKVTWIFRANNSEARETIQGFHNLDNIDVVLYGGSNLLRYYQPLEAYKEKGYTSYNYATSAATADLLKVYIEESRTSNEAILYVCDVRTMPLLGETIEETSLRNWSDSVTVFSIQRIKGITSFLFTRDWEGWDIPSFYFDIAKYHSEYGLLASSDQWSYMKAGSVYDVDKGFAPNTSANAVPFNEPIVIEERGELTEQQANTLNELLDYCDDENLQVLFIVCPYIITESDWKILNKCGDIIQSRGYDFINFNNYYDEIGLDFETDFVDKNHVNYLGSEKYTEYLMNYISDHYDLPDHRGDKAYSNWDDDYNEYTLQQASWKEEIVSLVNQHLAAKELGGNLSNINDFSSWFEAIQDSNFTIIVEKNQCKEYDTDNFAFHYMIDKWGIDVEQANYVGVWNGEEKLFSNNGEGGYKGIIGVGGGRAQVQCIVNAGEAPVISVNGIDYFNNSGGIQIVVFDNNYRKVVDCVNITVDDNEVNLVR